MYVQRHHVDLSDPNATLNKFCKLAQRINALANFLVEVPTIQAEIEGE